MPTEAFANSETNWSSLPIRSLGLTIKGTRLEPILTEFARELEHVGLRRVKPVFYLSTEWGVPFGTVAVAIPFYLAHPTLTKVHAERHGHVEGSGRRDILRYLRHEMGHVVNYAYRLYERPDWVERFGPIDREYEEEYHPEPFSRRFVRHLPGWYAQKHPDEDWAETFAVWMTPGQDWRADYADWPVALGKLEYCDRVVAGLKGLDPPVTAADLDEDVSELGHTLDEFYGGPAEAGAAESPRMLDGALRSLFGDYQPAEGEPAEPRRPAGELIRALQQPLMAEVYRWTGYFPERTRRLVRYLAGRADALGHVYPAGREGAVAVALTAFITAWSMNRSGETASRERQRPEEPSGR
jgi:hypothetical protein